MPIGKGPTGRRWCGRNLVMNPHHQRHWLLVWRKLWTACGTLEKRRTVLHDKVTVHAFEKGHE
eukprot:11853998-Prorocentrum_lima.AAC.1